MLKKLVATLAFLCASVSYAAVDVNKANAAELDGIKGIGPAMSQRILDERKKGDFKSWEDLIARVKGVGQNKAAKLSGEGLRVGASTYRGEDKPAATAGKQTAKAADKTSDKTSEKVADKK